MSSPLNVVQMEANRRNAQQSTGPRTDTGKKTSSMNALRHGLTSRAVVLPSEDQAAYETFSAEFLVELAPETFIERQFAQTIIDTQWRLNRVRTLEDGMLASDHSDAEVFLEHSKAFVNLSMHEQRLYRILKDASKSLDDLKTKRIAIRQAELNAAVALHNLNKMQGVPTDFKAAGFVFSAEEIETECRRHRRLLEATIAEKCNYDLKKFHQQLAMSA